MFVEWLENAESIKQYLDEIGMRKRKQKHLRRVEKTVRLVGGDKDVQRAALLHDLIERGGDVEVARRLFNLSDRTVNIIRHLSNTESSEQEDAPNVPLAHIQMILNSQDIASDEKQVVTIIKIADRLDNITRRINLGVGKNYSAKSADLLGWLFNFYYTNYGKDKPIKKLFKQYEDVNNQMRKKRQMDLQKPWAGFKEWLNGTN